MFARCHGVKCDGTLSCDICVNWMKDQWKKFERKKRSRHDRSSKYSDHSSAFDRLSPTAFFR